MSLNLTKYETGVLVIFLMISQIVYSQSVRVSSYNSSKDVNQAFESAVNSLFDTIIFDYKEKGWEISPMRLSKLSNKTIIFEKGVEIRAKSGVFENTSDALFRFTDCENLQILGNGAKFCMKKDEYIEGEWRHGISLRNSNNIIIKDLSIYDTGGDGIYIDGKDKFSYCRDIFIQNVHSFNNKRQGMSIISAVDVTVKDCTFSDTIGTLPGAGVDLEPDSKYNRLQNISFINCLFENNDHAGVVLALGKLNSNSKKINILFKNCTIRNNHSISNKYIASEIVIGANKINPVRGTVLFENCLIENSNWGFLYSTKISSSYLVKFKECMVKNISNSGDFSPIYLEVPEYHFGSFSLGGFSFENVYIEYGTDVALFTVRGSNFDTLSHLENITGIIYVKNKNIMNLNYINYNPEMNRNVYLNIINN